MSTAGSDPTGTGTGAGEPTEEELRAYEAEIKKVRVEHVLLEHIVTLVNLGMRRTGLAPGTETERDAGQVQLAIESVRALLPLVEQVAPPQAGPIRDALSQLQLAFVRIGGQREPASAPAVPPGAPSQPPGASSHPPGDTAPPAPGGTRPGPEQPAPEPPKPGEPGPAQRSGRLWIPGQ